MSFIRLTLTARYALEGMSCLARRWGPNTSGYLQASQVAHRSGLPAEFLSKIFRRLCARGLLDSRRGPGGGFLLSKDPARIRVADVVEAVHKPERGLRQCALRVNGCAGGRRWNPNPSARRRGSTLSLARRCPAHKTMARAERQVLAELRKLSLARLAD